MVICQSPLALLDDNVSHLIRTLRGFEHLILFQTPITETARLAATYDAPNPCKISHDQVVIINTVSRGSELRRLPTD